MKSYQSDFSSWCGGCKVDRQNRMQASVKATMEVYQYSALYMMIIFQAIVCFFLIWLFLFSFCSCWIGEQQRRRLLSSLQPHLPTKLNCVKNKKTTFFVSSFRCLVYIRGNGNGLFVRIKFKLSHFSDFCINKWRQMKTQFSFSY